MSNYNFSQFIHELETGLPGIQEQRATVAVVVNALQKLLNNQYLLDSEFVTALARGQTDGKIYHSPSLDFIIQVFGWPPGAHTPIHDHRTWGVMGIYMHTLEIREYALQPTAHPGRYELQQKAQYQAGPGSIAYVLSPEDEIHHISNPGPDYAISIHVYGHPLRNYHEFDPENGWIRWVES